MAQQMAKGQHFYWFFAGQNYNGAIEQYPQALLFAIGLPQNAFVLRLPQLALNLFGCALVYLVGTEVFKDRWRPLLASLLFAIGPLFQIVRGSTTTGSYTTQLVLGLAVLLLAIRLTDTLTHARRTGSAFVLGLALTGTFYLNASGYFVVLPALLWALPALLRMRLLPITTLGAVLGVLPNLFWSIRHFSSMFPSVGIVESTPGSRFQALLNPLGREFFGLAHATGTPGLPELPGRIIVCAAFLALFIAFIARYRSITSILRLRTTNRSPLTILLMSGVLGFVMLVGTKLAGLTFDPRYLYPSNVTLILLLAALSSPAAIAQVLTRFLRFFLSADHTPVLTKQFSFRTATAVSLATIVLLGTSTAVALSHSAVDSNGDYGQQSSANTDAQSSAAQLLDALHKDGTKYAYASYWEALPLDFQAKGSLTVVSYGAVNRFPERRAAVDAAPAQQVAWIGPPSIIKQALDGKHIGYRLRTFGRYTVYDRLTVATRPLLIGFGGP